MQDIKKDKKNLKLNNYCIVKSNGSCRQNWKIQRYQDKREFNILPTSSHKTWLFSIVSLLFSFFSLKILIYCIPPLLLPIFLNNWITCMTDFLHYASLSNWVKLIQNKVTHYFTMIGLNQHLPFFHCLFITRFFSLMFPEFFSCLKLGKPWA